VHGLPIQAATFSIWVVNSETCAGLNDEEYNPFIDGEVQVLFTPLVVIWSIKVPIGNCEVGKAFNPVMLYVPERDKLL